MGLLKKLFLGIGILLLMNIILMGISILEKGMVNSMHDELRKINAHLIIGMGDMLAGGGSKNPAPFVLFGKPTHLIGPDKL